MEVNKSLLQFMTSMVTFYDVLESPPVHPRLSTPPMSDRYSIDTMILYNKSIKRSSYYYLR